jgi:hypothetical protein
MVLEYVYVLDKLGLYVLYFKSLPTPCIFFIYRTRIEAINNKTSDFLHMGSINYFILQCM